MSFFNNNQIQPINTNQITCRTYKQFYPNINPVIYELSIYTAQSNTYTVVYITGENFFPYGTTSINFGTTYKNIPITYFSSSYISFVLPDNVTPSNYNVQVVNITPGMLNSGYLYSNIMIFAIT